jgi:hypothetical protein
MEITAGPAVANFKIQGLMSMPRVGWTDNAITMNSTIAATGIPVRTVTGAFWQQCLAGGIEDILAEDKADAILFVDYDSVFKPATVNALVALMMHSGVDAIAPLQLKREDGLLMLSFGDVDQNKPMVVNQDFFDEPVREVGTAHFGCTLVRTSILKKMAKPWFHETVDADGSYRGPHIDADIAFWRRLAEAGGRLGVATNVSIGHLELRVAWPSLSQPDGRIYSSPQSFWASGSPEGAHGVIE